MITRPALIRPNVRLSHRMNSTSSSASFTTPAFTIATAGNHTLSMIGTAMSGEKAVFIDSVSISP